MPRKTESDQIHPTKTSQPETIQDKIEDLKSISEVDREPINGGQRESDWRDAREVEMTTEGNEPRLEEGAD